MGDRVIKLLILALSLVFGCITFSIGSQAQETVNNAPRTIPKTWDEQALADLEVPLADPSHSPKHISVDNYYRIPVRPIYRSYPRYHPDKEPPGLSGMAQAARAGHSMRRWRAPPQAGDRGGLDQGR